jgi:predicted phage terminase large subunit-like protein
MADEPEKLTAAVLGGLRRLAMMPAGERQAILDGLSAEEMVELSTTWDRAVRQDLLMWSCHALGPMGQVPARHHRLLISYLRRVALPPEDPDKIDRLMVLMPPGSAKSTYATVLFPPWFLSQAPYLNVIGASHTADLAELFSRRILNLLGEHGPVLGTSLQTENVQAWMTNQGGEYKAAGIGGPITGRRADLAVIDDPFKGHAQADSEPERERIWNWYVTELLTRLKPGGRIVLINTRWHVDDLSGRLLEQEAHRWKVLDLPAFARDDDPLGREPGEALWPDWESADALRDKQKSIGARLWASLYQQSPTPSEGLLFEAGKIVTVPEAPAVVKVARGWDIAASDEGDASNPDWTAGVKMGRTAEGRFVVLDVVRFRGRPEEVDRRLRETAEADGKGVLQSVPQDVGAAGKAMAAHHARVLAGFPVTTSRETGSKVVRATPFASQVGAGNISIVKSKPGNPWNGPYLDELGLFPAGRKDDQVDGSSRAFEIIADKPRHNRSLRLGFMGR